MISGNGKVSSLTVAVDAMGGDHAPDEVLKGAVDAFREGVKVLLVGKQAELQRRLHDLDLPALPIHDAPDAISMDEPLKQVRHKDQSSLHRAARMLRSHEAGAMVSAGNSAAIMLVALSECGRQQGIDRPAFGGSMPTKSGDCFLLDIGANSVVTPTNLVQFGVMGEVYVRLAKGIVRPRVALLSNGSEDSKGTDEIKQANESLRKLDMEFIGNIEGITFSMERPMSW